MLKAGFVADVPDEAVHDWLRRAVHGPKVPERSWQTFFQQLTQPKGLYMCFLAVFWDILHPQGWVRSLWPQRYKSGCGLSFLDPFDFTGTR